LPGVALVASLVVSSVCAAAPTTIVLLEPDAPSAAARETMTRARSELVAAGFEVVVSTRSGADTREALERAMLATGATAAISIEPTSKSTVAEVWVNDGLTHKISIRPVETTGSNDTPALLAIRAVELLRASLIELTAPADGAPPNAPPDPVRRLVDGPSRLDSYRAGFAIEAGVAGLLGVSPLRPAVAPTLALSYGSAMGLGARLRWIGPTAGPGLQGALGRAEITEELLVGECVFAPPLDAPVGLYAAAGIGFLHLDASGQLVDPSRARSEGSTVFATSFGAGLDFRLDPHVTLGTEVFAVVTAPAIVVDMGTETIGTVGHPELGSSLRLVGVF